MISIPTRLATPPEHPRRKLDLEPHQPCVGCGTDLYPAKINGACVCCRRPLCAECATHQCRACGKNLGLHMVCKCNGAEYRNVDTERWCERCAPQIKEQAVDVREIDYDTAQAIHEPQAQGKFLIILDAVELREFTAALAKAESPRNAFLLIQPFLNRASMALNMGRR